MPPEKLEVQIRVVDIEPMRELLARFGAFVDTFEQWHSEVIASRNINACGERLLSDDQWQRTWKMRTELGEITRMVLRVTKGGAA